MTTETSKAKKTRKPRISVRSYTNDYGIDMLEIKTKPRNVYISVKKALAILNAKKYTEVHKYGRDLFKIEYNSGGSFIVGQNKIDVVKNNAVKVLAKIA